MRVIAAILMFVIIHTGTDARAQVTFDSHRKKEPLRKVLEDIRVQTGYLFFFQNEPTLLDQRVSVAFTHMSIDTFLKVYLGVEPDNYKLLDKTYLIKRKNTRPFGAIYSNIATLIDVDGSITDMKGDPLSDVTIALDGKAPQATTDSMGNFRLNRIAPDAVLLFWHVSMDPLRAPLDGRTRLSLRMREKPAELQNVTVVHVITTGYERIPPERATGSFNLIDRNLINRSVSTSLPNRIENLIAGVFTNHTQTPAGVPATDMPLIRGRSTLYANALPLIILDHFPYDGDISNINPNDIESISILKDAAAASIWGARAGNGVIVITTRKGRVNDSSMYSSLRPNFSYSSAITFQSAPDLSKVSNISSADFIDRERDLYNRGFIFPDNATPETPVTSLLRQVSDNTLTLAAANAGIEALKTIDVRRAMQKLFYRTGVEQQHFLQASSSTENAGYYVSAGWDHNLYNLTGSAYDRVSLRLQNVYRISAPLYIETGVNFTQTTNHQDANPGYNYRSPVGNKGFYPYARLVDALGNPLPLSLDYGADYLKAAAAAGFSDWSFVPVKDRKTEENTSKGHDLLINIGARYTFSPSLNLEIKYQYQNGGGEGTDLHDANSYYTRDLINRYAQMDPANKLHFPIPPGGIMDYTHRQTIAHQGRLQLNYHHSWSKRHHLWAIAGAEVRSMENTARFEREYGFKPEDNSFFGDIDYSTPYSTWQLSNPPVPIPRAASSTGMTDHFISYYTNAAYTWHDVLIASGSIREDFANLFGVKTNQKKVPLGSAGLAWQINKSDFYDWRAFPSLKLRATYGRGGNISRQASAYTTAIYAPFSAIGNPGNIGVIQGLSNPNLRWEQVAMFNLGLDFVSKRNIFTGSIEFYHKNATDLIAPAEADPTLGIVQTPGQPGIYYGNTASMQGSGVDLQLETHNLNGNLKWTTNLILSKATSTVTKYLLPVTNGYTYLDQTAISPLIGRPLYAIYSYRWAGLDPANGDPQGYYNGKTSKNWTSIKTNTPIDSMVYNGPSQPTVYGALRNTFRWRAFTASFNISYKFGYYFRRPSINYTGLFQTWVGHGDYARRWQNPGDEHRTFVPSASDPGNPDRDLFYLNSNVLVERADHIRLEDVQLSYEFTRNRYPSLPINGIRLYTYLSNLGLLWTANKKGIDPYYINIPPEGKRVSVGINVNF